MVTISCCAVTKVFMHTQPYNYLEQFKYSSASTLFVFVIFVGLFILIDSICSCVICHLLYPPLADFTFMNTNLVPVA